MAKQWVGIFGVDPGQTTGVVHGAVPIGGSVEHAVKRMKLRHEDQITSRGEGGVTGNGFSEELDIALQLLALYRDFWDECESRDVSVYCAIEGFVLTRFKSSERSGLSPVRIASSFEALLYQDCPEGMEWLYAPTFYQPSQSKSYAKDQRLKDWGLWTRGKEHARDAWRQWALHYTKIKEARS